MLKAIKRLLQSSLAYLVDLSIGTELFNNDILAVEVIGGISETAF